jgi:NADPH:quinone reductase-like Zn-dependent oxidoreductase
MGSKAEFLGLLEFLKETGLRPNIQATFDFSDAKEAFDLLASGEVFGKVVLVSS